MQSLQAEVHAQHQSAPKEPATGPDLTNDQANSVNP